MCKFHVLRTDEGETSFTDHSLIDVVMRDMNSGFKGTPFSFVRLPGVTYVDNTAWYSDLETSAEITQMFDSIDLPGTLDIILAPSIFGDTIRGAAAIPPNFVDHGIVLDSDDLGIPYTRTTPHEVGHALGLPHPFETAFGVECTSGSNCSTAGDRICDTPASPIVHSANMTATGIYYGGGNGPCFLDPPYNPLTDLFMDAGWPYGLAGGLIPSRFTNGQLAKMTGGMSTFNADLVGPSRPNVLVDCDGNDEDDIDEILAGAKPDADEDKVPDLCQIFPAVGDLIVSGMNNSTLNRPLFFDGASGAFRDELRSAISFAHQVRQGPDGLVYVTTQTVVQRISLATRRVHDNFIDGILEGASLFVDVLFEPNGHVLVLDLGTSNIRRYHGETGEYMGVFINLAAIGMSSSKFMEYGPDGNIYIVGNGALGNSVRRFNSITGADMGAFVPAGRGGLGAGQGLLFHTDGLLYVSNGSANNVLRFDAITAAFVDEFVESGAGGLSNPNSLRFGPDGHLYVASRNTHSVKRYDGANGDYLDDFIETGSGGLNQPTGVLFVSEPLPTPNPPTALDAVCFNGNTPTATPCGTNADCAEGQACRLKSRFLSINPADTAAAATPTALQVKVISVPGAPGAVNAPPYNYPAMVNDVWWVGAATERTNDQSNYITAPLVCTGTPLVQNWNAVGNIHIYGDGIVPGATYEIRSCATASGPCSAPLVLATARHGDTRDAYNLTNFADISALVGEFQAPNAPSSLLKSHAWITPSNMTTAMGSPFGFNQISAGVTAFSGGAPPAPTVGANQCP